MFIKWSIFGFLLKRPSMNKPEYKQSRIDDLTNINDYLNQYIQIPTTFNVTTTSLFRGLLGIDERHPPIEPDYNETLFRIVSNHKKQLVLNYLQNNNVGIYDKLEKIHYHNIMNCGESVMSHNITRGGLMKDWDFVM
jgi:hypothetical protein